MTTAKIRRSAINEAIRDAAIREFARNGLAGTSTQAIASSAGISKAQLHYYITSKEDLYQDVLGYIVSHWRELFSLSSSLEAPAEAIRNYIRNKIEHALEHPDVSRFFANEMARGAPEMGDYWEPQTIPSAPGSTRAKSRPSIRCCSRSTSGRSPNTMPNTRHRPAS